MCVQVACQNIFGKLLMRSITFLRPHVNQSSAQKIMGVQNGGSPNFKEF
jgi:hypothetical protein